MKKMNHVLSFLMVFAIAVFYSPVIAFAETENNLDKLFDTYYYIDTTTITIQDPYTMLSKGSDINSNKLIEMFSTSTNTRSELLQLCNDILNGEKLSNHMESEQDLYTITTDSMGKSTGYAIIDLNSFSVKEFGGLNEYNRRDFQLTESIQKNIAKLDLDLSTSKVAMCTIDNFSTGNLLYDKNNEYFIPSVESMESIGLLEFGNIYPVYEIAKIIENNIDNIFPPNQVDEQGNPYVGGTTMPSESTESSHVDKQEPPDTGGADIQPELTNSADKNNMQFSVYFYILGVVGIIACVSIIIKIIVRIKAHPSK